MVLAALSFSARQVMLLHMKTSRHISQQQKKPQVTNFSTQNTEIKKTRCFHISSKSTPTPLLLTLQVLHHVLGQPKTLEPDSDQPVFLQDLLDFAPAQVHQGSRGPSEPARRQRRRVMVARRTDDGSCPVGLAQVQTEKDPHLERNWINVTAKVGKSVQI